MSTTGPPPFDTTLLRALADAGVTASAWLQGACDGALTANDTWHSCDDYAEELTRILRELRSVRTLAFDEEIEQAIAGYSRPSTRRVSYRDVSANLRRMSGRDLAVARALSRVVVEGACEV